MVEDADDKIAKPKKSTRARKKPAPAVIPPETIEPPHMHPAAESAISDIKIGAWIIQHLPESFRPYALLMRLDRPIGIWLLLIPCYWGLAAGMEGLHGFANHLIVLPLLIAFTIGAVLMRGAGCIINDLWDRDIDPEVARTATRPLASGAITPKQATIFMAALIGVSAIILFTMNMATIALGIVALALAVLYPMMKRVTFWPQAFLGLTFNMGILMGSTAVTGGVTPTAFLLYLGAVSWTIAYDTIYAKQDIEDDARLGLKSTALLFGDNIRLCVAGFMTVTVGFFAMAGIAAHAFGTYYAMLALPALHAFLTLRQWNENQGASCLATFKAQRDFALLVLLALLFI